MSEAFVIWVLNEFVALAWGRAVAPQVRAMGRSGAHLLRSATRRFFLGTRFRSRVSCEGRSPRLIRLRRRIQQLRTGLVARHSELGVLVARPAFHAARFDSSWPVADFVTGNRREHLPTYQHMLI